MWMEHTTLEMTTNDRPGLLSEILAVLDGGSFDNVRVNLGIDISRKAGEVLVAALNIKSEVDGAIEQDKSNTLTQIELSYVASRYQITAHILFDMSKGSDDSPEPSSSPFPKFHWPPTKSLRHRHIKIELKLKVGGWF
ncbi:hypothetical protein Tco_0616664 [Tanacetum coccineum]